MTNGLRIYAYLFIIFAAAGCKTPIVTDAPAVAHYSAANQRQMGVEYDALPKDGQLRRFVNDCVSLRDRVR